MVPAFLLQNVMIHYADMEEWNMVHIDKKYFLVETVLLLAALAGCHGITGVTPGEAALETKLPKVNSTMPENGENHVGIEVNLKATFSHPISLASVDSAQFTLHLMGANIPASVTFDGTTAVLSPDSALIPSMHYTAYLNDGIVDNDGVPLVQYQWDFYTEGNGWSPVEQLDLAGIGNADDPQISTGVDGIALAVWSQNDGAHETIYSNYYTNDIGWGVAESIGVVGAGAGLDPQIDIDESGNALVVFAKLIDPGTEGEHRSIYSARYSATTGWGAAERIDTGQSGTTFGHRISSDAAGNAFAIWSEQVGSRDSIYSNRYTVGTGWGAAQLIESDDTYNAYSPQISVDAAGNAIAVWAQRIGSWASIYANRFSVGTGWAAAELIELGDAGSAEDPQISVDAAGNAVVVWTQFDGVRDSIFANHYSVGTGWGTAELIELDDFGNADVPQISGDGDGNVLAVWHQYDGPHRSVYANRYAVAGGWEGAELIESGDADHARNPEIGLDMEGNGLAVWYQDDGDKYGIYMNRYDANIGWGAAEQIEFDGGDSYHPKISVDNNGDALVVWTLEGLGFDKIKSARFEANVVAQ